MYHHIGKASINNCAWLAVFDLFSIVAYFKSMIVLAMDTHWGPIIVIVVLIGIKISSRIAIMWGSSI